MNNIECSAETEKLGVRGLLMLGDVVQKHVKIANYDCQSKVDSLIPVHCYWYWTNESETKIIRSKHVWIQYGWRVPSPFDVPLPKNRPENGANTASHETKQGL